MSRWEQENKEAKQDNQTQLMLLMSKEINISFNELHCLGTVITETETLTSVKMIFTETNDPPAEVSENGP